MFVPLRLKVSAVVVLLYVGPTQPRGASVQEQRTLGHVVQPDYDEEGNDGHDDDDDVDDDAPACHSLLPAERFGGGM